MGLWKLPKALGLPGESVTKKNGSQPLVDDEVEHDETTDSLPAGSGHVNNYINEDDDQAFCLGTYFDGNDALSGQLPNAAQIQGAIANTLSSTKITQANAVLLGQIAAAALAHVQLSSALPPVQGRLTNRGLRAFPPEVRYMIFRGVIDRRKTTVMMLPIIKALLGEKDLLEEALSVHRRKRNYYLNSANDWKLNRYDHKVLIGVENLNISF